MIVSNDEMSDMFLSKVGFCCFYRGLNKQILFSTSVNPIFRSLTQEIKRK